MREALHARAAQLPVSGGEYRDFADNTLDALQSGCDGAALALIRQAQHDAAMLLGAEPRLVLHGGGAAALHGASAQEKPLGEIATSLVLGGLAAYAFALNDAADTMPAC
jgi:type III pantothenate kinase